MPITARCSVPTLFSLGCLLALAAGCSSDPGPEHHSGRTGHHGPPPPPMAGEDTFFDGRITATLNVGPDAELADLPDPANGPKGGGDRSSPGPRGGGGGGGGFSAGGGGGMGGGHGHGHRGGDDSSTSGGGYAGAPQMMANHGPLVMIHLRFTNKGSTRVQLQVEDFASPLGNFAVQPEVLALEPGQTLETEPMSSIMAEPLAETQVTLTLRIADQEDKKIVMLRALPAVTPTPAPTPASPPAVTGK